ncbi:MAG: PPOX class F420-dependent oxidoreductase [Nakamurella sp.]
MTVQPAETFAALGNEPFVALTTFRKSGASVATTVWVAADGDGLLILTPAESGKVKRVRNNDAVELQPSSRGGKVADDAVTVSGTAEIISDAADVERLKAIFRDKYGLQFKIVMLIERILARGQKPRVILRIAAA